MYAVTQVTQTMGTVMMKQIIQSANGMEGIVVVIMLTQITAQHVNV